MIVDDDLNILAVTADSLKAFSIDQILMLEKYAEAALFSSLLFSLSVFSYRAS